MNLFSGRLNRINFALGYLIILIVIGAVYYLPTSQDSPIISVIQIIVAIPSLIYAFSLGSRRLHDTDHTGWIQLVFIVPLANAVLGLYQLLKNGSATSNKYGDPPKPGVDIRTVFGLTENKAVITPPFPHPPQQQA